MGMTALVMGPSGLVGRQVTKELLASPLVDEVRILVRREPNLNHPKLSVILTDWDKPEEIRHAFAGVHSVFSCLGTTMKKAGSKQEFRKVDQEYVLAGAKLAREAGVGQFLAVSSVGADPKAKTFYSRVKGEVEEELSAFGFPGLHLFRPSLLLGDREERRLGERIASVLMKRFDFLFKGKMAPYRAVPALKVARAMVAIALTNAKGNHIYPNEVIHVLGDDTMEAIPPA